MADAGVAQAAGEAGLLSEYLSRDETAKQLGVSPDTLTRWLTQRIGPASVRIGRKRYYHRDAIRRWIKSREQTFPAQAGRS